MTASLLAAEVILAYYRHEVLFSVVFAAFLLYSSFGVDADRGATARVALLVLLATSVWIINFGHFTFFPAFVIWVQLVYVTGRFLRERAGPPGRLGLRAQLAGLLLIVVVCVIYLSEVDRHYLSEYPQKLICGNAESRYRYYYGTWDQGCYLYMAKRIASGEWFPKGYADGFFFGVGLPIVAAPFVGMVEDPFRPFVVVSFVAVFWLAFLALTSLLPFYQAVVCLLLLLFTTPLASPFFDEAMTFTSFLLIPWNNSVPLLATAFLTYCLVARKQNLHFMAISGLLVGWSFCARYSDVIYLLIMAGWLIFANRTGVRSTVCRLLAFALPACAWAVFTLVVHQRFYGSPFKTYLSFIPGLAPAAFFYPLEIDRVVKQVASIFLFPDLTLTNSLSESLPILCYIPALFALPTLLVDKPRGVQSRVFAVCLVAAAVGVYFYGSSDGAKADFLLYGCVRYYMPVIWPLVLLATAACCRFILGGFEDDRSHRRRKLALIVTTTVVVIGQTMTGGAYYAWRNPVPSLKMEEGGHLALEIPGSPRKVITGVRLTGPGGVEIGDTAAGTLRVFDGDGGVHLIAAYPPGGPPRQQVTEHNRTYRISSSYPITALGGDYRAHVLTSRGELQTNTVAVLGSAINGDRSAPINNPVWLQSREWVGIPISNELTVKGGQSVVVLDLNVFEKRGEAYLDFSDGASPIGGFTDRHFPVGDIGMHRMLCPVPPDCRGSLRLRVVGRGTVGIRVSAIRIVS